MDKKKIYLQLQKFYAYEIHKNLFVSNQMAYNASFLDHFNSGTHHY